MHFVFCYSGQLCSRVVGISNDVLFMLVVYGVNVGTCVVIMALVCSMSGVNAGYMNTLWFHDAHQTRYDSAVQCYAGVDGV